MSVLLPVTEGGDTSSPSFFTKENIVPDNVTPGRFDPRILVDYYSGPIILMGSAACFWEDMDAAQGIYPDAHLMAINLTGNLYPEYFQHWASFHMNSPTFAREHRYMTASYKQGQITHLHGSTTGCKDGCFEWAVPNRGTSSMLAVRISLAMGYNPVILAGIPLDKSGYFFGPSIEKRGDFITHKMREDWQDQSEYWGDRVKSMSGWTKHLLGSP